MTNLSHVTIYTDGTCPGHLGPGGYGVVMLNEGYRREFSGGYWLTTNNRISLLGAIAGLKKLHHKSSVTLYSDSEYLVASMNSDRVRRWKAKGWFRDKNVKVPNIDLWDSILDLCDQHVVRFAWFKGHPGQVESERCRQLANEAARQEDLPIDEGYTPSR